ncbi:MAG: transcription termination/antitermination protein NusA [Bacteroidetes bacterium]|nr:transcription termination/antitermination protein NusA [Bacteroidota bacterium]MBK8658027.1 transcription termination/antitermination protein NusA [Bacteroidota bacterium]
MNSIGLIDSFSEFKQMKNIDRPTMMKVLEDVFRTLLRKKYGDVDNFDIIVNTDKGDLEIWHKREIVADDAVENPITQIGLSEAQKIEEDFDIGEETYEKIELESFGRRAILAARQTLASRVGDLEKDEVFKKYKDRIGEILSAEVYQVWKKEILLLDEEGNELLLPKSEQIKTDFFKKGETVRAVVKRVDIRNGTPVIILSRTDASFLSKLMEGEVPEIFDGLIVIRNIVREPGEKAKVVVESFDDRIDPVGACVGVKGSRIHGIVRELKNENIDIINHTQNLQLLVQRALAPAKINSLDIDQDKKRISVYLEPDQVSLAIGKRGVNIKLASRLVGYEIDVYRENEEGDEEEYDIDLDEFSDEIEEWMIDELKKIGCDTAKSVLALSDDELVRRTDLEEESILEIRKILESEFQEEK